MLQSRLADTDTHSELLNGVVGSVLLSMRETGYAPFTTRVSHQH